MIRAVYLDYAATTPVDARVAAVMAECLTRDGAFGNPGSLSHEYGEAASERVEWAREQVASAVGARAADIIWTSGATEANNLALFGVAQYYREAGRHIVTSRTEHKAVLDPCRELERRGWRVTYVTPRSDGSLDAADVAAALRPETVLVSVMHVNNEIGVIQDIPAIAAACAAHGTVRVHVDAAQSMGKVPLEFDRWGIDLLSLSAHKAYGPKGAGALVVARGRGVHLQPLLFGGGQERNLRSGTVATHQVAGMGAAFALASAGQGDEVRRIASLRNRLWSQLRTLGGVLRNGAAERCVAHLLNVSFEDVEGESLLAVVRPFVAVSTGSACTSAVQEPSYVLRALGRDERLAESSLRFSLGRFSTEDDVNRALGAVARGVAHLRRIAGSRIPNRALTGALSAESTEQGTPCTEAPREWNGAGDGPRVLRAMNYNDLTRRHFETAEAAGSLSGRGVRRGEAGSRSQGTWVQFEVQLEPGAGDRTVREVKFLAYACPHVIAVADWVAQQMVGRLAESVLPDSIAVLQQRFSVPIEKLGRLLIIEDAWIAAIMAPDSE